MKSTTRNATQRDTQRDIVVSSVASGVTITAAAGVLGVTVRTVQRRLDSGILRSIMRDGRRLVLLDSGATDRATENATQRDTMTRHATPNVASRDTAPDDMATKYVAQIEAENRFLRLQIEEGNRNAAELRSALRKSLDNAPRQLTAGTPAPDEPARTERFGPQNHDGRGREGDEQNRPQIAAESDEPTTYSSIANWLESQGI